MQEEVECGYYRICKAEYAEYAEVAGAGQGRNQMWS